MPTYAGRLSRKNFGLGILMIILISIVVIVIPEIFLIAALSGARDQATDANLQLQAQQDQINAIIQQGQSGTPTQP